MKNILIGVGVVVVVAGATYALVPRSVLKEYFQKGDKPTKQQFGTLIDSTVNLQDDRDMTGLKEYNPTKEYTVGDTAVKSDAIYQARVATDTKTDAGAGGTAAPAAIEATAPAQTVDTSGSAN